jgi:hypothetical protein
VSLVLGCLTTCLGLFGGAAPGAFGLVVGVVVGAAGHQGKQGPSDLVAGGGQGGLGVLVPGEGAGSVAVSLASRLTPDAGCQVQGGPSPPGRALRADAIARVGGAGWLRAGASPAARHTLDHSAQRPVWPTNATKPAAATVATPRIWVSLAPWVRASSGAISASRLAI